jgi:putative membrane protein
MFAAAALGFGCESQNNSTGAPGTSSPTTTPQGQTAQGGKTTQTSEMKLDDATKTRIVLTELHAANQAEINEGKLASDRAQSPDVKKFASDMVTDHTVADQKLTDLTKRLEIDINTAPTNPIEAAMSEAGDARKRMLSGLSGAAFDVAYVAPEAHEHELVLQIIDQGQKSASADVKRLLDEVKPTIESHREHAKTLLKGFRYESTAVGGGPAGGAHPSMEGADTTGRTDTSMTPAGAKHDGGAHVRKGMTPPTP